MAVQHDQQKKIFLKNRRKSAFEGGIIFFI